MSYSLIGRVAPEVVAPAFFNGSIVDSLSLRSYKERGKSLLLFFYPLDFTFVCPTELHAFQEQLHLFRERECEVVGCSVDSVYAHRAWWQLPKERGGIAGISYPLLSDTTRSISRDYGVLAEDRGIAYRGLFFIDSQGIVRAQMIYELALGRSVEEALRLIDAWQFHEKHGEVCPANWKRGQKALQPTEEGVSDYLAQE